MQSFLSDIDVRLVLEESFSYGYGSFTDRTITARLEVRYQDEIIHQEENYDITSS